MPSAQLEPVARFIRHAIVDAGLTDRQLLARFAAQRDQGAFSALVRRHGPLVLGVCRRVLRDVHAAEDAFQATFLLLARKAGSLASPERLSSWLHGVACRVATRARSQESRRRHRERNAPIPGPTVPDDAIDWRDLRAMLDEEVNRLPARQREAVVLCYLEGQTNAQAALSLGCPRGSVATLLARARHRLRQRLAGRGLAFPAVLADTWLARQTEAARLPASLACSTIEAATRCAAGGLQATLASGQAVALAKGVVRAMFLKKLKAAVAFILVAAALVGAGAGFTGRRADAEQIGEQPMASQPADPGKQATAAAPTPAPAPTEAATATPIAYDAGWPESARETTIQRTANFDVTAPTRESAQKVAQAAEKHRKALALLWLGKELPAWEKRCPVRVRLTELGAAGVSTFQFDDGSVVAQSMALEGNLKEILANALPHEMTHIVLADWSGRPLPRWADEGAALQAESKESRARHAQAVLTILDEKRALPLRRLLPLREYPPDVMAMFAQGFSLTDFLLSKGGRAKFLEFVKQGDRDSWAKSAKAHYGYATLDELEKAWLVYARKTPRIPAKMVGGTSGWSSLSRNDRKPTGKLPDGPAPVHALVQLNDGRLTVWRRTISYKPVTRNLPDRAGTVTSYEQINALLATDYAVEEVKVCDTRGQVIAQKKLPALLKGEMYVLVSADGKPVDPLHLRLVKEGTLVFMLPASLTPQPAIPPVAIPPSAPAVTDRPGRQ
jgi:RNA polymerase sigma factor (sigma-70 family)